MLVPKYYIKRVDFYLWLYNFFSHPHRFFLLSLLFLGIILTAHDFLRICKSLQITQSAKYASLRHTFGAIFRLLDNGQKII